MTGVQVPRNSPLNSHASLPHLPHTTQPVPCCCSWDFGTGAGFYLDATEDKWRQYRMYSYITQELPALLSSFPELDLGRVSGWLQGQLGMGSSRG